MGKYWLTSLPQVLRDAGLTVDTYSGWETRARSTGGYDGVFAVQVHHTASNTSPASDMSYMWNGSPDRPVGAIYLARDGRVTVGAAGATNTSGKGGPRDTVHGTIPLDSANKYVISIEAANAGTGEAWPKAQQDAYVKMCAALNAAYGLHVGDLHSHWEWTPGRKIDPAGNSRYASGGSSWNMDTFRGEVWLGVPTDPTDPPPPNPTPTPPPSNEWWHALMQELPTLRRGASGASVKRMQHLLAATGAMDPANVSNYDGQFGSGTESALKKFQGWAGGVQDGVCGPWTWGALMHTIDGIPTIKNGARGDDVERMQHLLAAAGFMNEANLSNYDGQWGSGTENAKIKFDNAKGLTPSPPTDCGQKSWTRLLKG